MVGRSSAICGRNWPNFELIRDFIVVIVTCKNADDSIEIEGARQGHKIIIMSIFRRSMADNSVVIEDN